MTASWYVLQSKAHKEEFLCDQLLSHNVKAFCPHIRTQPVNPRARKVKPYFPGYIFVQLDFENSQSSALHWMPGAVGFVSYDGRPADVPESLVNAIRRRVDEINAAGGELFESLKPGERVMINDGPFAGYEAVFDTRLSGMDRVRVLLKLLQQRRQFPLELFAGQIKQIPRH
ncbi:MAG TPA: transcription termination/antitermination NusG family protein [Anaerolineales bacterium]|jgi:transcriptional antiterminator RfaH|nr:transcription termination/antitermination NusG family protein [Anaerolineales bacterium]